MKRLSLTATLLAALPLTLAVACSDDAGEDDGTGGEGTGGEGTGGEGTGGEGTGGEGTGGAGGLGGLGGMGGAASANLEACQERCDYFQTLEGFDDCTGASADPELCVSNCTEEIFPYEACESEVSARVACEVTLSEEDWVCEEVYGGFAVTSSDCDDEINADIACYDEQWCAENSGHEDYDYYCQ